MWQNQKRLSLLPSDRVSSIGIRRHIKIKADPNPYDPEYAAYFWRRRNNKESRLFSALNAKEYRKAQAA